MLKTNAFAYMQGGPDLGDNAINCSKSRWQSFRCNNLLSTFLIYHMFNSLPLPCSSSLKMLYNLAFSVKITLCNFLLILIVCLVLDFYIVAMIVSLIILFVRKKVFCAHRLGGSSRTRRINSTDWTHFSSTQADPGTSDVVAPSPWTIFGCQNGKN